MVADRIAFDLIVKLLKPHGYYQPHSNPGIWWHEILPTIFAPCEGKFGIKYTNYDHAHHFVDTIKNTTQFPFIGEENINVALIYIEITTRNMSMSQCLAILQKPFKSSNIQHLRGLNMPHMTELPQPMDQESNTARHNQN